MPRALVILVVVLLGAILPNLFWLRRSTVRIENRGATAVTGVTLHACDGTIELGNLAPGASRFAVLPQCGDDTLAVTSAGASVCTVYVEGDMYHVRAWFDSPTAGDCAYALPPFAALLVWELR